MSGIGVRPISTPKERRAFVAFQWEAYQGDPCWVPPLVGECEAFIDPARNPSFRHLEHQLFVAERAGRMVGTVAAFVNSRHDSVHGERTGFFGFFETIPEYAAAEALLAAAGDWLRGRGLTALRGPAGFGMHDGIGMLVEGFHLPPAILTPYNPPCYPEFVERFGFTKTHDLLAYHLDLDVFRDHPDRAPARLVSAAAAAKERGDFTLRSPNMRRFPEELEHLRSIYNSAMAEHWGFEPLTEAEIAHRAMYLRPLLDPSTVFVAESAGHPVGLIVTLPDLNQPLRLAYPRPGVPEWWTLLKLWWHWKARRQVSVLRVYLVGVTQPYRNQGVDAMLYFRAGRAALRRGYRRLELSQISESNAVMNRTVRQLGARVSRRYRVYERALS